MNDKTQAITQDSDTSSQPEKETSFFRSTGENEKSKKRFQPLNSYKWQGLMWFLVIVACIAFGFIILRFDSIIKDFQVLLGILKPIIIGIILAYILNPVMKSFEKFFYRIFKKESSDPKAKKQIRSISLLITIILFLVVIGILLAAILPDLAVSISNLVTDLPGYVSSFSNWISHLSVDDKYQVYVQQILDQTEHVETWIKTSLSSQLNEIVATLKAGILGVFNVLYNFFIGLIVSIYILSTKEKFKAQSKKLLYAVFQENTSNSILQIARDSDKIFLGFLTGKIIDSAIIGIICFIFLSIFQIPYTLIVSVIVGITNIIPFFGPYIGGIPSAILIFLADPKAGIFFIIFIVILQQIDGNLIGPKILGNTTGLSAFWVIFSILLGSGLFGFAGMIFGVPVFAVIYHIIHQLVNKQIARKKMPLETDKYADVYRVEQASLVYKPRTQDIEEKVEELEN